jgi:hypothetical protein
LSLAQEECRKLLRGMLDPKTQGNTLSLQTLCLLHFA